MHFPSSGLLIISIHVYPNCTMSSHLVFEDTARQPVHKGDKDYSNYLISPQTICLFYVLSSCCFGDESVRKKWKQFNGSLYKPFLLLGPRPGALYSWRGQDTGWRGGNSVGGARAGDGQWRQSPWPWLVPKSTCIWNHNPKLFNYRLCDLGKLFNLKDSRYSYLQYWIL